MDLARGSEWQSVDDYGMNCTIAQQPEQRGHVGLELLQVRRSARRDAVEQRTRDLWSQTDKRQCEKRSGQRILFERRVVGILPGEQTMRQMQVALKYSF